MISIIQSENTYTAIEGTNAQPEDEQDKLYCSQSKEKVH